MLKAVLFENWVYSKSDAIKRCWFHGVGPTDLIRVAAPISQSPLYDNDNSAILPVRTDFTCATMTDALLKTIMFTSVICHMQVHFHPRIIWVPLPEMTSSEALYCQISAYWLLCCQNGATLCLRISHPPYNSLQLDKIALRCWEVCCYVRTFVMRCLFTSPGYSKVVSVFFWPITQNPYIYIYSTDISLFSIIHQKTAWLAQLHGAGDVPLDLLYRVWNEVLLHFSSGFTILNSSWTIWYSCKLNRTLTENRGRQLVLRHFRSTAHYRLSQFSVLALFMRILRALQILQLASYDIFVRVV